MNIRLCSISQSFITKYGMVVIYMYIYVIYMESGSSQLPLAAGVSCNVTKVITTATPSNVRLVVELSL
jgi:hypothetical protein